MNTEDVKKYKTSDIALAATLILHGHDLLYIEPVNKKTAGKSDIFHFVFVEFPERESFVIKYSSNNPDVNVSPNSFRAMIRHLKEKAKNFATS